MSRSPPQTPYTSSAILSHDPWQGSSTTRLQALYSDFSRQKQSNPVSFQTNVEWWKKALQTIVTTVLQEEPSSASGLILHADSSLMTLVKVPKVGKPLALGTVLAELHASNTFIPINEFMALKSSLYATRSLPIRVASYVVGKPLWWALEQAGIVGDEGIFGSGSRDRHKGTSWYGDYVLVPLLEAAGDATTVLQESRSGSPADALYSWASFSQAFSNVVEGSNREQLHKDDLKVLLKYLERDRGVLVYDKEVIKFVDPSTPSNARTITTIDRGVLELKNAVASMHSQVESLQQKIDQCTKDASSALKQGRKPVALTRVRIRKQYQELLSKRLNSLSTLESTLLSVEASMGDVEIMNSYELSTATLKSILAHPSLERDNIDKTMEALAEANIDAKEIDDAVRIAGDVAVGTSEGIDDASVEAEWAALVKEMGGDTELDDLKRTLEGSKAPTHTPQVHPARRDSERQAVPA